jgi:methylphosphotriester-DNA--protein-cysteine methyltransferase
MEKVSASVLITQNADRNGVSATATIRAVRRDPADVPILLLLSTATDRDAVQRDLGDALQAGRIGVSAVLRSTDTSFGRDIAVMLQEVPRPQMRNQLASIALGGDECAVARLIRRAIEYGEHPLTVAMLAHLEGVERTTLNRRLKLRYKASVGSIIAFARLLAVQVYRESGRVSINRAAVDLDFPSATSLRNLAKRYLGVTLEHVSRNGGAAFVARTLREYLEHRSIPSRDC